MLRPLLAFGTLCAVALLLAPTVQSVHEGVESLHIKRDTWWHLWKWQRDEAPPPPGNPICDDKNLTLEPTVLGWPERITKNESFNVTGHVLSPMEANAPVPGDTLELFLNATKELPGEPLGVATTLGDGTFSLETKVPHELSATHYHIVAHALEKRDGCKRYTDNWSDPEMDVTAHTRILLDAPDRVVVGRATRLSGVVVDDVGAPVRGENVTLSIGGEVRHLVTDNGGRFTTAWTPRSGGNATLEASFAATPYYGASSARAFVAIVSEDVELDEAASGTLLLVRGEPREITGHVYLAPNASRGSVTLAVEGTRVATCADCAPTSTITVQPDADGTFHVTLLVPHGEPGGAATLTASGGGLRAPFRFALDVKVPVTLTLAAHDDGPFHRSFRGSLVARDDAGRVLPALPVAVETSSGWASGSTDDAGSFAFHASAPCGVQRVRALFNGTGPYMPTLQDREVSVCGFLAGAPAWLLHAPWWSWPLALLAILALYLLARRLMTRYAPVLSRGPPLHLRFVEPADAAADVVGVGDTVVLAARLDEPLPEGHRVRFGAHRAMADATVDGLEARHAFVASELGDTAVRAEIVDARGRVVTRRTATLHVVRYAEEIEARYLAQRDQLGIPESATPREFESWLQERAPDVDATVARNLAGLFVEADYSPRVAGRAEFLAFLTAQKGVRPPVG